MSDSTTPLLYAEHIDKVFFTPDPLRIIKNVTISVQPHETVAILGKSGEGKSTLMHILGTIEPPTAGKLFIKGELVSNDPCVIRNKELGFIFQSFHLLNDQTVLENVLMPMKIARTNTKIQSPGYQRALDLIDQVGLTHRMHFACNKLSGGERQRAAIARAFANDPDIIFADEPTGNLDHNTAIDVQQLLFSFTKSHKKALVLVTHNEELAKLCDTHYRLENGNLLRINLFS